MVTNAQDWQTANARHPTLGVRLTAEKMRELRARAAEEGTTASSLARQAILEKFTDEAGQAPDSTTDQPAAQEAAPLPRP
jgi:hypothetical protein